MSLDRGPPKSHMPSSSLISWIYFVNLLLHFKRRTIRFNMTDLPTFKIFVCWWCLLQFLCCGVVFLVLFLMKLENLFTKRFRFSQYEFCSSFFVSWSTIVFNVIPFSLHGRVLIFISFSFSNSNSCFINLPKIISTFIVVRSRLRDSCYLWLLSSIQGF